jgi:hypothetical protein
MPKHKRTYEVEIVTSFRHTAEVTVECENGDDGYAAAENAARAIPVPRDFSVGVDTVNVLRQTGEPWVEPIMVDGWHHDLGSDRDIVVVSLSRSLGHRFSSAEIVLLSKRLSLLGYKILDQYCSNYCNTVSFRCQHETPPTIEELAVLCAPKPST